MTKHATTGLTSLDEILHGLRVGDNVVWQIDNPEDYQHFVSAFVHQALAENHRLIYMRFANHAPVISDSKVLVYSLDAYSGFESFSRQVHSIITQEGRGVYYVFDCLSDLLLAWATDQMIGNFFMLTCPYLFELDTIAYFAIRRSQHSFKTVARIRETTQLLLDVYYCENHYYIHPLKVWNRYSPTMFLPHQQQENQWIPITSSVDTSHLFRHICKLAPDSTRRHLDYWDLLFLKVEAMVQKPAPSSEQEQMLERLCRVIIGKDQRMLSLFQQYATLPDFLAIKDRMIGTGFIGGKSVGMLLARKILQNDPTTPWQNILEPHDSFYVGSDVCYSYIVQNGWWKLWMEQKTPAGYFTAAEQLQKKLLSGNFPEEITEQFQQMIEYFGQSPIIVRSSSLLEDSFGNAFAGKYESIFLANQGTPEKRYQHFITAVRRIYASTMSEEALVYRRERGLDQQDEQMALLVQRVSGSHQGRYFFPFCAGVGVSYNTFVWERNMDPQAGMLRLVFGLGTRAVNRVEGDYPRLVALDAPNLRPYASGQEAKEFSQHAVDVLDIRTNQWTTVSWLQLIRELPGLPLDWIAARDNEATQSWRNRGILDQEVWVLTFDHLLAQTDFVARIQSMLKTLEAVYHYPIDIEFTVNFAQDQSLQINLLQCRPLQTKSLGPKVVLPETLEPSQTVFHFQGHFAGGNIAQPIHQVILIDPLRYAALPITQKYSVARLIGKLNRLIPSPEALPTLLLGPGRWGTSTPSLGVPVSFSEINKIAVLAEVAFPSGQLMPELSYGTHFFQDLVETGIFYTAIFPENPGVTYHPEWLLKLPNRFLELMPENPENINVIQVFDTRPQHLQLLADIVSQTIVCFAAEPK